MKPIQQIFTIIVFSGLIFFSQKAFSADTPIPGNFHCGADALREQLFKNDPATALRHAALEADVYNFSQQKSGGFPSVLKSPLSGTVNIPVVIHVVHNGGVENISDAQILQGMADLNNAFKNSGAFKSDAGVDIEIEFCLAQQDEFGRFTTGITRHISTLTDVVMENNDISLKKIGRWDPRKYLNIWIVREVASVSSGKGVSGYAFFPSSHGQAQDGIVMEAQYFGTSDDNSKVLVHEVGHYLGLYHTFEGGCINADCLGDGDRVCDTPPDASTSLYQCSTPVNTCTSDENDHSLNNPFRPVLKGGLGDQNDLITNYLDYGDVRCQVAFTNGQKERMRFFLETVRKSLLDSRGCETVCLAEIIPSISPSATTVDVGISVLFENNTTGASEYRWEVNGVFYSSIEEPAFVPPMEGIYTVRMVASNEDIACTEEANVIIEAICPVRAAFAVSRKNIMPGDNITFQNTSSGEAVSYLWLLDGVQQSSQFNYSHPFANPGTYTIGLIASGPVCADTAYQVIRVGNCISKRGNVWHFGNGAGLDFTNDMPVEITSPLKKESWEGCSSICNTDGIFLFSTDGKTVWTNSGTPMPNGTGLLGRASAAQSSLIVPMPGDDNLYYIFTVDGWEAKPDSLSKGLRYSVVDMRLNSGRGDIIPDKKNILLHAPTTEQLGGVIHCNGKDTWVMAHDWGSNKFLAYLVTKDSVSSVPVVSETGVRYDGITGSFPLDQAISTLKFSHNGRKLATGLYHRDTVELFDFDNSTGRLLNPLVLKIPNAYGLEFSPDISKLYVASFDNRSIYQVDFKKRNYRDSIIKLWSELSGANTGGSLQLAPNGKIYYASGRGFGSNTKFSRKIGVINSPNESGILCNYQDNGILLAKGTNNSGLPNFVQSIFFDGQPAIDGPSSLCITSGPVEYSSSSLECTGETSFQWFFKGDIRIISTTTNKAVVEFTKPGVHQVIIMKNGRCGVSYDTVDVSVFLPKEVALGDDVSLCQGFDFTLDAGAGFKEYRWQDGSRKQTFTASKPGKYWVSVVSEGGCISADTIEVFKTNPTAALSISDKDTMELCDGTVTTLKAGSGFKTYRWQDGSDGENYTVFQPGKYKVTVQDYCGRNLHDSVVITPSFKTLEVSGDISICMGDSVQISVNSLYPVIWSPSAGLSDPYVHNPVARPQQTTDYTVTAIDNDGCKSLGTVRVAIAERIPVALRFDYQSVAAGTENFTLPVHCSANGTLPAVLKDLSFEMEYDPMLFQPESVSKGNFQIGVRGGKTFLRVEVGDITLYQANQELLTIGAKILAGDSAVMPLVFEKVSLAEGCVEIAARHSGELTVTGCSLDERQADFNGGVSLSVAPNPAENEVEISIYAFETGEHSVKIFDVQGKAVWQESFKNDGATLLKKLQVNLTSFAEGAYQVVLSTPTISRTTVLQVLR